MTQVSQSEMRSALQAANPLFPPGSEQQSRFSAGGTSPSAAAAAAAARSQLVGASQAAAQRGSPAAGPARGATASQGAPLELPAAAPAAPAADSQLQVIPETAEEGGSTPPAIGVGAAGIAAAVANAAAAGGEATAAPQPGPGSAVGGDWDASQLSLSLTGQASAQNADTPRPQIYMQPAQDVTNAGAQGLGYLLGYPETLNLAPSVLTASFAPEAATQLEQPASLRQPAAAAIVLASDSMAQPAEALLALAPAPGAAAAAAASPVATPRGGDKPLLGSTGSETQDMQQEEEAPGGDAANGEAEVPSLCHFYCDCAVMFETRMDRTPANDSWQAKLQPVRCPLVPSNGCFSCLLNLQTSI